MSRSPHKLTMSSMSAKSLRRRAMSFSRITSSGVMTRTRLGEIPADYYEHNVGLGFPGLGIGFGKGSSQSVYRDVPVYGSDGRPQLQQLQRTFDTARYGPVSGAILGGLIGGGVGLAAGVAGGLLLKLVVSHPTDKPPKKDS